MKWCENYLKVYEKPFETAPQYALEVVRNKMRNLEKYEKPLVSVVLICFNEENRLLSCLWSLCENKCDLPMEILAVNNNSSDNTENVLQQLGVTYYNEFKKGPGFARQCGLNHAKGKYHICIDADTMYPPYFISIHLNKLMKPDVVGTFSLWSFIPEKGRPKLGLWFYETLRDIHLSIQAIKRPELCVRGMAFGFNTELGRKFGFRTDIRRGEDGSLALAIKPYGKLIFIHSKKTRVLTGNATLKVEGSLLHSFTKRLMEAFVNASMLFTKRNKYNDDKDNLI
ncbi:glycosyltransferase family 2 protein [Bacteroides sp.]|uniref:glycosyltransferase family 2 protein n=1 Tax=Bacteroides sp. TaxID=29523 RepID=UPI0026232492|nr:glycosyltransferase family 2 protein [Bacteroides sp.]MDD3037763.1 glycosyltransferase family 2 protein [Bacteroides sp.]